MCRRVCVCLYACVCMYVISRVHAHRGCGHSSTNHFKWLLLLALSPAFSALGQYLIRLSLSFSGLRPPFPPLAACYAGQCGCACADCVAASPSRFPRTHSHLP